MANQPKNYKKFVATAATATLVASAIVPVASAASFSDIEGNTHADAIKALSDAGIIKGYEDGTFKPNAEINRGQTVKLLGRWLETKGYKVPENWNTVQRFNDLPVNAADSELVKYAALVKDAGVFNGSNGNLNYSQPMQRQQMALVLVRAIKTVEGIDLIQDYKEAGFTSSIKDLDKAYSTENVEAITALEYAGITVVENFNPTSAITRGQFASFLNRTINYEVPVKVESVSAINANTLTVTGTGLKDLTAEDITVEDNTVSTVTVAEDGKTATVKLKNPLVVDVATKVTVKDASFDVTYKIEATEVKIAEGQFFDDDTEKQFIQILVNGKAVTAQELITAGYTVEFEATDRRSGGNPVNIFTGDSATSTTGELADNLHELLGDDASVDYYVTLTLTKGSEVFVTPNTKITIKNLDSAVSNITNGVIEVTSDSTFNSTFDLVSSTLVAGDTAKFKELHVTVGGTKEIVDLSGLSSMYSVTSSDESVISVNKADYTLTAEGPGTATITVTYGGQTYTKTLTVKSEKRKIATAKLNKTSVNIGKGDTAGDFKVQILDQYGDPVHATPGTDFTVHSSDETVAKVQEIDSTPSTDGKLEFKVIVEGVDTGTADFTIRNKADTRIGSSVRVNVTDNVTISKYTLTVDNSISDGDVKKVQDAGGTDATKNNISTTSTIDTRDKKYVKIDVKAFNSANQLLPDPTAGTDFEVTAVNASDSDVLDETFGTKGVVANDDYLIVKAGSNDGTVTITITDKNNSNVKQSIKLTVTDKGVAVTNVAFKNVPTINYATTLDYEDFLSYTKSGDRDPRINGLTLSRNYSQAVRLTSDIVGETTLTNVDSLYIDLDGDGAFTVGEPVVGYVGMATTGDVYVNGDVNKTAVKATDGYAVEAGSDGYVIFRVYNDKGEIVATKAVKVDI
ncbi:S-layer homology domain-containing protein [Ureibacillus sp. FSL K6-2830]|uniref:S-layer homology domain-containing protein n=1 Tax=Ureibacillus sp. FSL K6-2830 TaxID=2954610 RepID=UPI0030F9AE88